MISSQDEITCGGIHDLQIFRLDFVIEVSKDPPGSLPVDRNKKIVGKILKPRNT